MDHYDGSDDVEGEGEEGDEQGDEEEGDEEEEDDGDVFGCDVCQSVIDSTKQRRHTCNTTQHNTRGTFMHVVRCRECDVVMVFQ